MDALIKGAYYPLIAFVFLFESNGVRAFLLITICIFAVFAFVGAKQREELASDIPTSKIKDAGYGYVELYGTASQSGEFSLKDPITHEPCLWFKIVTYQIYTDSDGRRNKAQLKTAESSYPFLLSDGSGTCLVYPQGGEYLLDSALTVADGKSIEHVVTRVCAGDKLYILGDIKNNKVPMSAPDADEPPTDREIKQRAQAIIKDWQQVPAVLANFDQNQDGALDSSEVKRVHAAAMHGARIDLQKDRSKAHTVQKVVHKPYSDRPFLVASRTPEEMRTHYSGAGTVHSIIAVASFVGAVYFFLR